MLEKIQIYRNTSSLFHNSLLHSHPHTSHTPHPYLWGIPMTKLCTPCSLARSMMCFIAGMSTSHPSSPNLFSLGHFNFRNSSNLFEVCELVRVWTGECKGWGCVRMCEGMWWCVRVCDGVTYMVARTNLAKSIFLARSSRDMALGTSNCSLIQSPVRVWGQSSELMWGVLG